MTWATRVTADDDGFMWNFSAAALLTKCGVIVKDLLLNIGSEYVWSSKLSKSIVSGCRTNFSSHCVREMAKVDVRR
jgi:hypothetical protein